MTERLGWGPSSTSPASSEDTDQDDYVLVRKRKSAVANHRDYTREYMRRWRANRNAGTQPVPTPEK